MASTTYIDGAHTDVLDWDSSIQLQCAAQSWYVYGACTVNLGVNMYARLNSLFRTTPRETECVHCIYIHTLPSMPTM